MPEGKIAQEGTFSEEQAVKCQRLEQGPSKCGPSALPEVADAIEDDDCLLLDTVGAVCVNSSGAGPLLGYQQLLVSQPCRWHMGMLV